MLLVSIGYLLFLFVTCLLYYALPVGKRKWALAPASLFFFWTNSGFLVIWLIYSTLTAFLYGKYHIKGRKCQLALIIILLALPLIGFKWGNLILGDLSNGKDFISIAAPVGISFYTLSLIGYCIDCYRQKYTPDSHFLHFLLFSSFFPHIVQGPIARYDQLGKTLYKEEKFQYDSFCKGCQLILWGFLLKLVIADRAAIIVNHIFDPGREREGMYIAVAFVLYSIQLYTDFLGCVCIARGSAQLFGVELSHNFSQPYFASSIQDFWRRWHISLSSWLRDYIYIPLGGNRKGVVRKRWNILATFAVSGLWHGAGLHFFAWGLLHGMYQTAGDLLKPVKEKMISFLSISPENRLLKIANIMITFTLVTIAWALFRADSIGHFLHLIRNLFGEPHLEVLWNAAAFELLGMRRLYCVPMGIALLLLFCSDLLHEKGFRIRDRIALLPMPVRWSVFLGAIVFVAVFGVYGPEYSAQQFIYGQF